MTSNIQGQDITIPLIDHFHQKANIPIVVYLSDDGESKEINAYMEYEDVYVSTPQDIKAFMNPSMSHTQIYENLCNQAHIEHDFNGDINIDRAQAYVDYIKAIAHRGASFMVKYRDAQVTLPRFPRFADHTHD